MQFDDIVLVTGCTGQDGNLLLDILPKYNCKVIGTTRSVESARLLREYHKNDPLVDVYDLDLSNITLVKKFIDTVNPSIIFHLAAQSSVARSFISPDETHASIMDTTYNILQSIVDKNCRLINFASSECFGECSDIGANEQTNFKPVSPYGVAKVGSVLMAETFARQYGLTATNLFLFNHESLNRPKKFVTSKIVDTAVNIFKKKEDTIVMGNCDVVRDWLWARELLEFVVKYRNKMPPRLVLGSGIETTLREFAEAIFEHLDLDFGRHLRTDEKFTRPDEILFSKADCQLAHRTLDWSPQISGTQVAQKLIRSRCVDRDIHE